MKILLFGITRDIVGRRELTLEADGTLRVADLLARLRADYPALRELRSLQVAVDQQIAAEDADISDGAEVALIPPVSGG